MVWRVADVSATATSRACHARGIWRTTRQTDKRAALRQQTGLVTNYEDAYLVEFRL